jgi:hypothetical protein
MRSACRALAAARAGIGDENHSSFAVAGRYTRAMIDIEGTRLSPDKILLAVAILLGILTTALSL